MINIKKISLIILATIYINLFIPIISLANTNDNIVYINEEKQILTPEQKQKLKDKKNELKEKYLKNWKNKSIFEKNEALRKYKKEMDEFCQKEFGLSYKELKEKYHNYFNRKSR